MLPEAVLWIDPGMDTGLAALIDHGTRFYCDEYRFMEAGSNIERFCQLYGRRAAVGWESYVVDPARPQKDAHHALEMIGVARRYATLSMCQQIEPASPGKMKPATTAMLKRLGWWVPAKDDAQAAARHMLAWLMRTGQVPPRERELLNQLAERAG
jgi:hypothetical protein